MYDWVDQKTVLRDAVFFRCGANLLKDCKPAFRALRHAGVGAGQRDHLPAGVCNQWKDGLDFSVFHGDGVDDARALAVWQNVR